MAKIKLRRDTTANWTYSNPVLALGEPGYDTTVHKLKIGDGATSWTSLAYVTSNLEEITSNLQSQIDYVKSNLNPAELDSLTEIVAAFQGVDANVIANVSTIQTKVSNLESNAEVQHAAISVLESNVSVQQANITLLLNERDRLVNSSANLILTGGANPYVTFPAISSGEQLFIQGSELASATGNLAITSRGDLYVISNGEGIGGGSSLLVFTSQGNLVLPQTNMMASPQPVSYPGITFTDGTFQTTAFTGSSAKVDIVNTNGLATTYYPTFVEARTNAQDVRADVDLTYRTDDNLLRSGNIQVGHNIYGSYRSGLSNAIQFRPNIDLDKRFLLTVDSSGGTYVRSSMEMPGAEVDKAVTLVFPHDNGNAGYIYTQGTDTAGTEFNNAFNIMMNSGNVKISALSGGGNKVWNFTTSGQLIYPDATIQTTAFTGTATPNNIINTHDSINIIIVGSTQAVFGSLSVRVTNASNTLGVEVQYSDTNTATISAFKAHPNTTNIYAGTVTKLGSNTDWDNFGNLTTVGDSMSFTVSDHSFHKIYRVLVTARAIPDGGSTAGDAYCVIEKLK